MKVAFFGYRDWAIKIFKALEPMQAILTVVPFHEAEVVLFYGWSSMISITLKWNL